MADLEGWPSWETDSELESYLASFCRGQWLFSQRPVLLNIWSQKSGSIWLMCKSTMATLLLYRITSGLGAVLSTREPANSTSRTETSTPCTWSTPGMFLGCVFRVCFVCRLCLREYSLCVDCVFRVCALCVVCAFRVCVCSVRRLCLPGVYSVCRLCLSGVCFVCSPYCVSRQLP